MAETRFRMSAGPCAIIQAESWPGASPAFEADLSARLGSNLPAAYGQAVLSGGWQIIRLAPRRFWLIADSGANLPGSIDPTLGCLTSLSEGRMRLRLGGTGVFDVLGACVAIDWHSPDAAPGRAVQTSFHHVPVLAVRTEAAACDLLVPRSYTRSLEEWIAGAANALAA